MKLPGLRIGLATLFHPSKAKVGYHGGSVIYPQSVDGGLPPCLVPHQRPCSLLVARNGSEGTFSDCRNGGTEKILDIHWVLMFYQAGSHGEMRGRRTSNWKNEIERRSILYSPFLWYCQVCYKCRTAASGTDETKAVFFQVA